MENLLKAHKLHLASDRTSCTRACANQVRLFLQGAAYWLLWTFQSLMPKRSPWRVAQFDTLRNRLIKLVTAVTETSDRIRSALAPKRPGPGVPGRGYPHRRLGAPRPVRHLTAGPCARTQEPIPATPNPPPLLAIKTRPHGSRETCN